MNSKLSLRYQMLSAWSGPVFLVTFIIFWGFLGGNLPSPAGPALTAQQVAAHYQHSITIKQIGFAGAMVSIALLLPWTALLTIQLAKIEGRYPVLSLLQLLGGALTVMVVSGSVVFWAATVLRHGQDPNTIRLLNDLGWIFVDGQFFCTTLQMYATSAVGLADKSTTPLFPRWVNWLAIFCGSTFFLATVTLTIKTGPFAWNGAITYYFAYSCWLVWYVIATFYMIAEVKRRKLNSPSEDGQPLSNLLPV